MSISMKFVCFVMLASMQIVQPTTLIEVFTIFSRYVQNPSQVGEVVPISQAAGVELARFVGKGAAGKKYLEAGGGCGAVSICLANLLRPEDHLDVIEIDSEMCEILKKRLHGYSNVSIHCCSILDWSVEYKYDGIISTLPFNSLGIDFTKSSIELFQSVSNKNCVFSYVEYPIVKQAFQYFYFGKLKKNFKAVQNYLNSIRQKYLIKEKIIYFNVPPIAIYHICFDND